MAEHRVGTREEWLAARKQLLEREKELTRRSDELARERQQLPGVQVEKEYKFDTDAGPKSLGELFDGRSQLLVFISCSVRKTRPRAPAAPIWRTTSTAPSCTSPTAT
jgi:predicted dithiol-disulfide oxidoreductase (DUF899 family)